MSGCLMLSIITVHIHCNGFQCVLTCIDPLSQPHDQSMESTPKDPVYDVAKQGLAKSSPTPDKNKTEITVSSC